MWTLIVKYWQPKVLCLPIKTFVSWIWPAHCQFVTLHCAHLPLLLWFCTHSSEAAGLEGAEALESIRPGSKTWLGNLQSMQPWRQYWISPTFLKQETDNRIYPIGFLGWNEMKYVMNLSRIRMVTHTRPEWNLSSGRPRGTVCQHPHVSPGPVLEYLLTGTHPCRGQFIPLLGSFTRQKVLAYVKPKSACRDFFHS